MSTRQVRTQAELAKALADGVDWIDLVGNGEFTVTAYGSATVRAYGSATVTAYDLVPVHDYGPRTTVEAALHIPVKVPETMQEWTDYYGSPVSRGWATVYKAVDADLKSGYGFSYPVGDEVKAPDWSDVASCGQGLHFSPRAFMALSYAPNASRFLACKVKVSECVVLGDKIKAPRCKVLAEVNEDGDEVSA